LYYKQRRTTKAGWEGGMRNIRFRSCNGDVAPQLVAV
jgi:hypothetical protein